MKRFALSTISTLWTILGLLIHSAWTRPVLPQPPMGTGAGAFSGGGVAFRSGANALFVNPAAIFIPDGFEAEAGMMGLSSGMSPYFLYGSKIREHTAYALGYYYDGRADTAAGGTAPRQGIIAGGSWEVDPKATLGVSAHTQGTGAGLGLDGFGVDVDVGAVVRPGNMLWTGLVIRNLQESGVGQEPGGYRTLRSYLMAIGLRRSVYDVLGIRFQDPSTFYELRTWGFPPSNFAHAFSLGSAFLPNGKLALRGAFLIPHRGQPGFAVGTFLNFPARLASIVGGYTYDSGDGDDVIGERGPSHSLSLNFHRSTLRTELAPVVEVRADNLVLKPDSAGHVQVHFRLSTGARILDWKLAVHAVRADGQTGGIVKIFEGKDMPPRLIRWEGKDEAGKETLPGLYAFRFSARNLQDREASTTWQLMERLGIGVSDSLNIK